jgi:hypothetical protein
MRIVEDFNTDRTRIYEKIQATFEFWEGLGHV